MQESPDKILANLDTRRPELIYQGPTAQRDSSELLSEVMNHVPSPGRVLDLGCGPRDQAAPLEYLGHEYVGVDHNSEQADFQADAHALPFQDETFDIVLSYAVLEHLHNPFVALREIERILRPNGVFIGTVSQGEPFHGSYFHHTTWGLISLLECTSNMRIERLWPSTDTLFSLSRMGRYPKAIKWLIEGVAQVDRSLPWLAPRRCNWADSKKRIDALHRTGSICFVIVKIQGSDGHNDAIRRGTDCSDIERNH